MGRDAHPHLTLFSLGRQGWDEGSHAPLKLGVARFLASVRGQALVKIALAIQEPDADQGQAEIARLFAVIAGQHAQTAAVNGHRVVQAELGREIGDGRLAELRGRGGGGRECRVKRPQDRVIACEKIRVAGQAAQAPGGDSAEQCDRIGRAAGDARLPQTRVNRREQLRRFRMPAPPQVGGEIAQSPNARGKGLGEGGWGHGFSRAGSGLCSRLSVRVKVLSRFPRRGVLHACPSFGLGRGVSKVVP